MSWGRNSRNIAWYCLVLTLFQRLKQNVRRRKTEKSLMPDHDSEGHVDHTEDERDLHLVAVEVLDTVGGREPDRVHSHGVGSPRVGPRVLRVQHELLRQVERRAGAG